jgi:hypothetical protein
MKHCVLVAPENSGMANQLKHTNYILRKSVESVAVVGVPANNQMKSSSRSNVGGDANIRHSQHLRKSAESVAVVGVPANNQMKSSLRSNVGGDANIRHSQHLRETNLLFIPRFRTFGRQQSLQRNTKDFKGAKPLKEI